MIEERFWRSPIIGRHPDPRSIEAWPDLAGGCILVRTKYPVWPYRYDLFCRNCGERERSPPVKNGPSYLQAWV